jgi:DNA-directed RNA polymerase specialized sigma24 family protein
MVWGLADRYLRPLGEDVASNARGAALRDPRFPPVTLPELASISVEISILSDPSPLVFSDHDDLIAFRSWLDRAAVLSDRERSVVRLTFGVGGSEPVSRIEIAERLGLSKTAVTQIKDRAIEKLRWAVA